MTNIVISHEKNNSPQQLSVIKAQAAILATYETSDLVLNETIMLDPKRLPFLENWQEQNNLHTSTTAICTLPPPEFNSKNTQENVLKPASVIDIEASCVIIKDNESVLSEVPLFYLCEEYAASCKKYNIPYKPVYHSYRELDAIEEEVADYVDLLKTARNLCIYWDTSTYDPEGLQEAIDEYHDEEAELDYLASVRGDSWDYYSRLGV